MIIQRNAIFVSELYFQKGLINSEHIKQIFEGKYVGFILHCPIDISNDQKSENGTYETR